MSSEMVSLTAAERELLAAAYRMRMEKNDVTVRSLAEALSLFPAAVSRCANTLVARGFLTMDRRAVLSMTEAGLEKGAALCRRGEIVCTFLARIRMSDGTADDAAFREGRQIEPYLSAETVAAMERFLNVDSVSKETERQQQMQTAPHSSIPIIRLHGE